MRNRNVVLAQYAHQHRQRPTDSEEALWRSLRRSQLGVSFRRQVVLLGFIVDFYAPAVRLAVEVDGAYHARRRGADARRDRKLRAIGVRVVRVAAEQVRVDLPAALGAIRGAIS